MTVLSCHCLCVVTADARRYKEQLDAYWKAHPEEAKNRKVRRRDTCVKHDLHV